MGGGLPVGKSLQAGIDTLKRLIDNTAAASGGSLLMGGVGDDKLYDPYYRAIADCCDYAAEKQGSPGPCRTAECHRPAAPPLRRTGESPQLPPVVRSGQYLLPDGKLNPADDAPSVAGLVTGMCVKDFTMSEVDGKLVKEVMVTPGTGKVDFPAVMARLKQEDSPPARWSSKDSPAATPNNSSARPNKPASSSNSWSPASSVPHVHGFALYMFVDRRQRPGDRLRSNTICHDTAPTNSG